MKKILTLASILGIASLSNSIFLAPAKAVEADVTINVEVPEVVYLQTYESITYNVDIFKAGSNVKKVQGVNVSSDGTPDAELPEPEDLSKNNTVTTPEFVAYKIWGIGGANGKLKAEVKYIGSELKKDASVVGIELKSATTGEFEVPESGGLDPAKPVIEGKVQFDFDLSKVTQAGLHVPGEGEALKITATAL